MELALITAQQVVVLFLLIGTGMVAVKTGVLKLENKQALSNLLVYIIVPAMVVNSYRMEFSTQILHNLLAAFGMSVLSVLLGTVITEDRVELAWRMQQAGPLSVDLLSSDGRVLRTLWSAALGAGEHRQHFALPAGLASGAYLLRFTTQQGVATVRFLRQ